MIRIILVTLAIAVCAYAETCNFTTVHQCVKGGGQQNNPEQHGRNDSRRAEFKAKVEKCFKDASCKLPEHKEDKTKREAVHKCKSQIIQKVKSDIQQCVQKTNKDFKFPEHKEGQHRHHHHHHKHGEHKFGKLINESCPTDQAKSSAKSCLQALKPAKGSSKTKQDSKEKKQKFCQKLNTCVQKLSPTCQTQFNNTKQAVCKCAKDIITQQAVQLEASLKACRPQGSNNNGGQHHGSTRKPKVPGEHLIKKFCRSCSSN